jgi:hypothetical protein
MISGRSMIRIPRKRVRRFRIQSPFSSFPLSVYCLLLGRLQCPPSALQPKTSLPFCHKGNVIKPTARFKKRNTNGMYRNQIDGERIWMALDPAECIRTNSEQNNDPLTIIALWIQTGSWHSNRHYGWEDY